MIICDCLPYTNKLFRILYNVVFNFLKSFALWNVDAFCVAAVHEIGENRFCSSFIVGLTSGKQHSSFSLGAKAAIMNVRKF